MGWMKFANRLADKPHVFSETEKRQFLGFQIENPTKLTLFWHPELDLNQRPSA
jgi:hypothetical protein